MGIVGLLRTGGEVGSCEGMRGIRVIRSIEIPECRNDD